MANPTLIEEIQELRRRITMLERREGGSWAADGTPLEMLRQVYLGNAGLGVGTLSDPASPWRARYLWSFPPFQAQITTVSGLAARVWLMPFQVPYQVEVDRIGYQVGAASAGNIRMGIYREGPTAGLPDGGALVVESASVAQGGVNSIQMVIIAATVLTPGMYYVVWQGDNANATWYAWRDNANTWPTCYTRAGGYGAFTDPCPTTGGIFGDYILCFLRVSRSLGLF
jgi:hypothetical protein